MLLRTTTVIALAASLTAAATPHVPVPPMRAAIESALAESVAGWNSGDLDQFVAVYLNSDQTTFATPTRYLHGRGAIRAHYAPRFAPGVRRDSLRLDEVEIDSLAPTIANVTAFYVLTRGDSTTARGPTSLLMRKVTGGWVIVHDHSS